MSNFITQLLLLSITVSVTVNYQLCGNQDHEKTVDQAFIDSRIVRDLRIKLPSDGLDLIEVTYSSTVPRRMVSCGTKLKTSQTLVQPMIKYPSESETIYTFMLLDLDVPSRSAPILRSFIHWMVINVEGDNLESGFNIHPYINPIPPPFSGRHRYVFLVFEQRNKFDAGVGATSINRNNFNVAEWAELNQVSGPVSGNYFLQRNP